MSRYIHRTPRTIYDQARERGWPPLHALALVYGPRRHEVVAFGDFPLVFPAPGHRRTTWTP